MTSCAAAAADDADAGEETTRAMAVEMSCDVRMGPLVPSLRDFETNIQERPRPTTLRFMEYTETIDFLDPGEIVSRKAAVVEVSKSREAILANKNESVVSTSAGESLSTFSTIS